MIKIAIIKKYLENSDPKKGCISHKDQEMYGLTLRKVCHRRDGSAEQMIIQGEEKEVNEFIARNPQITEITEQYLDKLIKKGWMPEQRICAECGQQHTATPFKMDNIKKIQI